MVKGGISKLKQWQKRKDVFIVPSIKAHPQKVLDWAFEKNFDIDFLDRFYENDKEYTVWKVPENFETMFCLKWN